MISDILEMEAIYALRCALAHDYSLFNVSRYPERYPNRTHAFKFVVNEMDPLVALPHRCWQGDYHDLTPDRETIVNLRKVGDLGEQVVLNLRKAHAENRLSLRLDLQEFEVRYGMVFPIG